MDATEVALAGGGSTHVHRRGNVVLREARDWSGTVLGLLRHLHERGFGAAPRPVDGGFAADGREQLAFIEGEAAPACWSEQAIHAVGELIRAAHEAAADFPRAGKWMPWWGRGLRSEDVVIGHCDVAPWNFLAVDGMPMALLDWDTAGPVGREWEVAQAAWLNARLHDDDVAARQQLPDAAARARLLAGFCDGYRLEAEHRRRLVDDMIEVAVRTAAQEVIDSGVSPDGLTPASVGGLGGGPPYQGGEVLWAVTWRIRSARWMFEHRHMLERALHV